MDAAVGVPNVGAKASWIMRVVAAIIDGIILGIVSAILNSVLDPTISGVVGLVISLAYLYYFWTTTGQTVGHKVLNLRVVRTDGGPLTTQNAILRYLGFIVESIPVVGWIGFIWPLFDANGQAWHDKIGGTYVVRA